MNNQKDKVVYNEPHVIQGAREVLRDQSFIPVFASLSGSHLYGYPSKDSDYDVRGCYLLPLEKLLCLEKPCLSICKEFKYQDDLLDVSLHEVSQYLGLLSKSDINVIEHLNSPEIIAISDIGYEIKELSKDSVSKRLGESYRNYANSIKKSLKGTVKEYLYLARIYLAGKNLLDTGLVDSNILSLIDSRYSSLIGDLIEQKRSSEKKYFDGNISHLENMLQNLEKDFEESYSKSKLPELQGNIKDIDNFLINLRKRQFAQSLEIKTSRTIYSPEEIMLEYLRLFNEGIISQSKFFVIFDDYYRNEYVYGKQRNKIYPTEDCPKEFKEVYDAIQGSVGESSSLHTSLSLFDSEEIIKRISDKLKVSKRSKIIIDY